MYRDLCDDIESYNEVGEHWVDGVESIVKGWVAAFSPGATGYGKITKDYTTGYGFAKLPWQFYTDVDSILVRMVWLIEAVQKKSMDAKDREYLHVLCRQLVRDVSEAIDAPIRELADKMKALGEVPAIVKAGNTPMLEEQRRLWIEERLTGRIAKIRDLLDRLAEQVEKEMTENERTSVTR